MWRRAWDVLTDMANRVAQGADPQHRWRRELSPGQPFVLRRETAPNEGRAVHIRHVRNNLQTLGDYMDYDPPPFAAMEPPEAMARFSSSTFALRRTFDEVAHRRPSAYIFANSTRYDLAESFVAGK